MPFARQHHAHELQRRIDIDPGVTFAVEALEDRGVGDRPQQGIDGQRPQPAVEGLAPVGREQWLRQHRLDQHAGAAEDRTAGSEQRRLRLVDDARQLARDDLNGRAARSAAVAVAGRSVGCAGGPLRPARRCRWWPTLIRAPSSATRPQASAALNSRSRTSCSSSLPPATIWNRLKAAGVEGVVARAGPRLGDDLAFPLERRARPCLVAFFRLVFGTRQLDQPARCWNGLARAGGVPLVERPVGAPARGRHT